MYQHIVRPLLFRIDAEKAHHLAMGVLQAAVRVPGVQAFLRHLLAPTGSVTARTVMGLTFPNPVGLAAGFDKDARYLQALAPLGFGFVETGTLTPRPQPGNPRPRLFRLPADRALVNRMGFNNGGVKAAAMRLRQRPPGLIVGGNIGKNKDTPNHRAADDYAYCLEALYEVVDYFVVNVSSPNTPGLRALQDKEPLQELLMRMQEIIHSKPVARPLLLKIAPDLDEQQLADIAGIVEHTGIAGVVATNTTISREGLQTPPARLEKIDSGGLSGAPLKNRATDTIRTLRILLGPETVIIGVGGIMSPADAVEKIQAGANLVQIYTGFIYNGPSFVKKINRAIVRAGV